MQNTIKKAVSQQDVLDGFDQAKLPIDRDSIRSRRLLRLIELVEVLRTPDQQRTIWQMLLDAGANPDYILMRDCDDDVQNGDDREFGKNRTLSFASSCNQFIVFSMDERKWRKLFDKQIGIL